MSWALKATDNRAKKGKMSFICQASEKGKFSDY
jgi:hypothetical protein